jgi:hypothetical protein
MSKPPTSLIDCPHCGAKYKVLRVEAPAAFDKYVTCLGCGGALETREGGFYAEIPSCETTNYDFVDAVARTNVQITVDNVRKDSAVLAELERNGTIKIVGAMYNLKTATLEFLS